MIFVAGVLSCAYGCSSEEKMNFDNINFEDLIIDENIGEKWDGAGLPSWFYDRFFDYTNKETEWHIESYLGATLYNVYKVNYKGNLLLVLSYDRFGCSETYYNESGTICFTDDGRRIRYDDIKNSLKEESELIWTNELGSEEYTMDVADSKLNGTDGLDWLQPVVDKVYQEIEEPDQVLCRLAFGYAYDETETYIIVDYKYFDKNQLQKGEICVRNVYKMDGTMIELFKNLKTEELCVQRITDIFSKK